MLKLLFRPFSKPPIPPGPVTITVTGAAGQVSYSFLFRLLSGNLFGNSHPIILKLHDQHSMKKVLSGLRMELQDCAFPLLKDITITDNYAEAFYDSDYAFLFGSKPRTAGMERRDLLRHNGEIFVTVGHEMAKYAKKSIKVLVAGNPVNTNCLILMAHAHGLPRENFSALTRLDHNRALAQLADHLKVHVSDINGIGIWGNNGSSMYPDITHIRINDEATSFDQIWYETHFIPTMQTRGDSIIHMRGVSSAASAASAALDHMRDWVFGTHQKWVSMGVCTDLFHNHFNIPKGLVFSYPLICTHSAFHIIKHIHHSPFSQSKLDITISDLLSEKEQVKDLLKD